jgi:hypothetical protein
MQMAHWCPSIPLRTGWSRYTLDGSIPWKLFWVYYRQIPRISAMAKLHDMEAVVNGIAVALSDPKDTRKVDKLVAGLRAEAEGED